MLQCSYQSKKQQTIQDTNQCKYAFHRDEFMPHLRTSDVRTLFPAGTHRTLVPEMRLAFAAPRITVAL